MTKKEAIEAKIKTLKAQLAAETARTAKAERAARTRELIQLGAMLAADKDQAALVAKYKAKIAEGEKKKAAPKAAK